MQTEQTLTEQAKQQYVDDVFARADGLTKELIGDAKACPCTKSDILARCDARDIDGFLRIQKLFTVVADNIVERTDGDQFDLAALGYCIATITHAKAELARRAEDVLGISRLRVTNSSMVESIGYNPVTRTLAVEYKSTLGTVYAYKDVPPLLAKDALDTVENEELSLGKFIIKNIKPNYTVEKFATPKEAE
jgi:hypothetical protein